MAFVEEQIKTPTYILSGILPRMPNETLIGPKRSTPLTLNGRMLRRRSAGRLPNICEYCRCLCRKQWVHRRTTALHSLRALISQILWPSKPTSANVTIGAMKMLKVQSNRIIFLRHLKGILNVMFQWSVQQPATNSPPTCYVQLRTVSVLKNGLSFWKKFAKYR